LAKKGADMETTLDKFGRIVIPKKIRNDFNLKPGDQIRIEQKEQVIILKPVEGEPNLHWKDGVLVFSGTPIGEYGEVLEKHREDRINKFG
jgi:AbrB family looped-hinge helix DNA binding protein